AADPGMGNDARGVARVHPARMVGRHLPRPCYPGHGAGDQPRRRRVARRARSETEEELTMPLLDIENLAVDFATATGRFRAVDGISLRVDAGEVLAIVGE